MKGALLAQANGYDQKVESAAYSSYAKERTQEFQKELEGASLTSTIAGTLLGHIAKPTTVKEIAMSPAKIVGKTIAGGVAKAFGVEFGIGLFGETLREQQIREHMERANLDYTLWDSVKSIFAGATVAGTFRGVGSGVVDLNILRKVDSSGMEATDKEILGRFFQREEYKLTTNSVSNIELLHKAEDDINGGRPVDVADHTDIDINTKTDDAIKEVNLREELTKKDNKNGYDQEVQSFEETFQKAPEPKEGTDADPYEGMATKQEAEETISDMAEFDPEIKAEMEAIRVERRTSKKLPSQAEKVKDASVPGIGAEIDAEKKAVNNLFIKNTSDEARYKGMSKDDIIEQNRMDIEDTVKEMEADGVIFAKGADNVAVGVAASIEVDEEGNISINPEKFVAGLGGYTALKALAKNPKVQKEFKDYVGRVLDDLESKQGSQFVTGKQEIVPLGQSKLKQRIAEAKKNKTEVSKAIEANKEAPLKIKTLEKLPKEYEKLDLSIKQEEFFKRAIPKIEELKKETQIFIAKKPPAPKKIYRGEVLEGEERIGGGAKEGFGLYTTVDKKLASQYGRISEMNVATDLPKKPLVFSGMNEFEIWEQTLDFKVLKYRRLSEKGSVALNEVVNLIDPTVDGIQIGSGIGVKSGTYWVKFPTIEEFRNFEK